MAGLAAGLGLAACAGEPVDQAREAARAAGPEIVRIRWGSGAEEAGFRPKAAEIGAEGPSSVAVRGASIVILDRRNERVIEVNGNAVRVAAEVPRDAEHLAIGPDGALAAWSPLRATVWLRARDGQPAGEITVPRVLRDVTAIHLADSRRVQLETAFQETMDLGSPRAPLDLSATLRTKREGAGFLPDGHGVAVRRIDGRAAELLVMGEGATSGRESRHAVLRRIRVEGPLDAARIVGSAGSVVCMRIERVAGAPAVSVEREARCIDAETGATVLRAALPPPGPYTPHEELAVGRNPPTLAAITPQEDGLLVQRWSLPATRSTEVAR
ncbi:MAG: hypothetical protein QM820_34520 [Minicystis sp.]